MPFYISYSVIQSHLGNITAVQERAQWSGSDNAHFVVKEVKVQ